MPLDTVLNLLRVDDAMLEVGAHDSEYVKVERLVNSASSLIERITGKDWKQRIVTLRLNGDGSVLLDLGSPVISITTVQVGGNNLSNPQMLTTDDYIVLGARGQLYRAGGWTIGVRNIEVACVLGEPIPHHIREAALRLVRHWYGQSLTSGASDLRSEHIGEYEYTRFDPGSGKFPGVPDDILGLLLSERRWAI